MCTEHNIWTKIFLLFIFPMISLFSGHKQLSLSRGTGSGSYNHCEFKFRKIQQTHNLVFYWHLEVYFLSEISSSVLCLFQNRLIFELQRSVFHKRRNATIDVPFLSSLVDQSTSILKLLLDSKGPRLVHHSLIHFHKQFFSQTIQCMLNMLNISVYTINLRQIWCFLTVSISQF
jgi:hypothetical protein